MNSLLCDLKRLICLCCPDDAIIYASTFAEHLQRLNRVFRCMRQGNLCLNGNIHNFYCLKLWQSSPDKTRAVANVPTFGTIKDIRSFFGIRLYVSRFIPGFPGIAEIPTRLLQKFVSFVWRQGQSAAFSCLETLTLPQGSLILHSTFLQSCILMKAIMASEGSSFKLTI